jgi:hypothetical protein
MRVNYKRLVRLPSDVPLNLVLVYVVQELLSFMQHSQLAKLVLVTVAVYGTGGVGMYICR